jgi:hypothetical protein
MVLPSPLTEIDAFDNKSIIPFWALSGRLLARGCTGHPGPGWRNGLSSVARILEPYWVASGRNPVGTDGTRIFFIDKENESTHHPPVTIAEKQYVTTSD